MASRALLRFDAQELVRRVPGMLSALPKRSYDVHLPASEQRDAAEYLRRSQRKAAVCVSLCNVDREASLLFTLRSSAVGTHAGQVSFPGGHVDEGETPEMACVRELLEETAMHCDVLGRWHPVRAVTGTMVQPMLCFIAEPLSATQVEAAAETSVEVERAFAVPVEALCRQEARTAEKLPGRWTMPRFQAHDRHPPIWGLTAFILDGVLRDVVAPFFHLPPLDSIANESSTSSL